MKNLFTFLICITIIPFFTLANIINVPADQPTIQAGINAAATGDTVLVADSTYYENINFKGKAISVASHFFIDGDTTHIDSTIINGSQPSHPDSGSVVYFISGEDTNSVLSGFTISGGSGTDFISGSSLRTAGGGIFSYYSGPSICNNIIENNIVYHVTRYTHGGGIYTGPIGSDKYIIIEDNKIQFNTVEAVNGNAYGGGIRISSNGRVVRNIIKNNEANCSASRTGGGGIYCFNENIKPYKFVTIKENVISNNQSVSNSYYAKSGGVGLSYTNCSIDSNTISNNISNGATGGNATGIHIYYADSISVIKNNLISFNTGGGIQIEFTNGMTVKDNSLENNVTNRSGGGIWEYQCNNTKIIQNEIIGNIASNNGGGIYEYQCANTLILENEFIENISGSCGGLFMNQTSGLTVQENRFEGNEGGYGGGILESECTNTKIVNNDIIGNIATVWGGGIQNFSSTNTLISKNTVSGNSAPSAAGILVDQSHSRVINNLIVGNNASSVGGGMVIYYSTSEQSVKSHLNFKNMNPVHDAYFSGEETRNNSYKSVNKQIAVLDSQTVLINNTICDNFAGVSGGGIYNELEQTEIINSIFWGNTSPVGKDIHNVNGLINVSYSDIQDSIWQGIGNISADPLFADTLYQLSVGSPCIDAGNPDSIYIDPDGSRNDMGAYGGPSAPVVGLYDEDDNDKMPNIYYLGQNYPNPFNPTTTIKFSIPKPEFITLNIYNILGQKVATLVSKKLVSGTYNYKWDASGFASGLYFYQLISEKRFVLTRKLILLR